MLTHDHEQLFDLINKTLAAFIRNTINTMITKDPPEFQVIPCFVNSEEAVSIVHIEDNKDPERVSIRPLFVTVTPSMAVTNEDGVLATKNGNGIPDDVYNMLHPDLKEVPNVPTT